MPTFAYQGQSQQGLKLGTLEADSQAAVAEALLAQGITPFDIVEKSQAEGAGQQITEFLSKHFPSLSGRTNGSVESAPGTQGRRKSRVYKPLVSVSARPRSIKSMLGIKENPSKEDVMMLSRQLHVLMHAGVPIIEGLGSLRDSTFSPPLKQVLVDVIEKLESGQALSGCLANHPNVFDDFFVSMVRIGEETGKLDEVFWSLYERMEFDERIRRQIKTATRYPIFVLSAIGIALAVVNLMVIPAFAKVFDSMGTQLPLLTRMLLWTSNFAQQQLPYIAVAMVGCYLLFNTWIKTQEGRLIWHDTLLKAPLFGSIILKASLARFCRGMALSLSSGVPVLQALTIVARTTDNEAIAVRLSGMRETIERGESVLGAAQQSGVFPRMVLQMIAVGDQSGQLDDMMNEVSTSYTKDVQYELQTFSQRLEPILIGVMGVLVLILALGIFLPIWDLGRVTMGKG